MILREKRKFDHKNRLNVPAEFIRGAGGKVNGDVYVQFDEKTRKIELLFGEEENETEKER